MWSFSSVIINFSYFIRKFEWVDGVWEANAVHASETSWAFYSHAWVLGQTVKPVVPIDIIEVPKFHINVKITKISTSTTIVICSTILVSAWVICIQWLFNSAPFFIPVNTAVLIWILAIIVYFTSSGQHNSSATEWFQVLGNGSTGGNAE